MEKIKLELFCRENGAMIYGLVMCNGFSWRPGERKLIVDGIHINDVVTWKAEGFDHQLLDDETVGKDVSHYETVENMKELQA